MEEFLQAFNDFLKNDCLRSKSFHFWNTFLNDILLILNDLTISHHESDQNIHVSAVCQALPLFFAFHRKN